MTPRATLATHSSPPVLGAQDRAWSFQAARPRRQRAVLALLTSDAVTLALVLPLAIWASRLFTEASGPGVSERPVSVLIVLGAIPFLAILGLYSRRWRISEAVVGDFPRVLFAMTLHSFLALLLIHSADASVDTLLNAEVFAFWFFAIMAIPLVRAATRRLIVPRVIGHQRTVIVGAGWVGQSIARKLLRHPELNLEVVGFVDTDPQPIADDLEHLPVLGSEERLTQIVHEADADRVIMTFSRTTPEHFVETMRWSDLHQINVTIVPRFFEVMTSNVDLDDIGGIPVLDLRPVQLSRSALAIKRTTDLALTLLALPLLVVAFAAIAVAIKIDSPGPVFFRQPRAGRRGRTFRIFKFRTMVDGAELQRMDMAQLNELVGPLFKIKEDPRVTRVGRFLRKTSLDELPQLINVLRGEMGLVGPRPFVIHEDQEITGWARRRLDVTPGITGVWQVMGRNDMPFDEMVKLDYLYVTRWSLTWDIKILLQTIPVVLRRRGAY